MVTLCVRLLYRVPKKGATKLMVVTSSNLNRFSKFFHRWKEKEMSNKMTYYFPPHLKYVAALPVRIQKLKFDVKLPNKIKTRIIPSYIHTIRGEWPKPPIAEAAAWAQMRFKLA